MHMEAGQVEPNRCARGSTEGAAVGMGVYGETHLPSLLEKPGKLASSSSICLMPSWKITDRLLKEKHLSLTSNCPLFVSNREIYLCETHKIVQRHLLWGPYKKNIDLYCI